MDALTKSDLVKLTRERAQPAPLPTPGQAAPILARTGLAPSAGRAQTGGSGSIASPLTETDIGARTYHSTAVEVQSADGLFTVQYFPLASVTLTDANGKQVVLNFADPTVG